MTGAVRYPPETKERARGLRLRGETIADIAAYVGASPSTVKDWLNGVQSPVDRRRCPRKVISERKRQQIRELYESGVKSFKDIGQMVGVSAGAARWHSGADRRNTAGPKPTVSSVVLHEVVTFADGGRLTVSHGMGAKHARQTALAMSRRRKVLSHTTEAA